MNINDRIIIYLVTSLISEVSYCRQGMMKTPSLNEGRTEQYRRQVPNSVTVTLFRTEKRIPDKWPRMSLARPTVLIFQRSNPGYHTHQM